MLAQLCDKWILIYGPTEPAASVELARIIDAKKSFIAKQLITSNLPAAINLRLAKTLLNSNNDLVANSNNCQITIKQYVLNKASNNWFSWYNWN